MRDVTGVGKFFSATLTLVAAFNVIKICEFLLTRRARIKLKKIFIRKALWCCKFFDLCVIYDRVLSLSRFDFINLQFINFAIG